MRKISEARLNMIGAQSARWPSTDVNHWNRLRAAVVAARDVAREADAKIGEVEANRDLSEVGKLRRIGEIGRAAINDLDSLAEMTQAEQAAARWLEALNGRKVSVAAPTDSHAAGLQAEIRAMLRARENPITFAMAHRGDPAMAGAILNAPAYLSGLSDEQWSAFSEAAESSLSPEVVGQQREVEGALQVARKAIEQAKTIVAERGQLLKTADGYKAKAA